MGNSDAILAPSRGVLFKVSLSVREKKEVSFSRGDISCCGISESQDLSNELEEDYSLSKSSLDCHYQILWWSCEHDSLC